MSADNTVTPSGVAAEAQEPRPAFDIPAELATRYQVRIVETPGSGERRVGLFLSGDRTNPSLEIANDRIVARKEDPETISSLVKLAQHNGWDKIDVEGSPDFRKAVWSAATRAGLTVNGYEPSFAEAAQMATLRGEDAERRARATAAQAVPAAEAAMDSPGAVQASAERQSEPQLAEQAQSARFRVGQWQHDQKAYVMIGETNSPSEAIALFGNAVDTNVIDTRSGQTLASTEWVNDGAYPRRNVSPELKRLATLEREDQLAARSAGEQSRQPEMQPHPAGEERPRDGGADRRRESEELAELFLHGAMEKVAADPRLSNALQAQSAMETHIAEVFQGDAGQIATASLESRKLISDVLRRGLDVSVREPTPVRQIEPIQSPDLER